MTDTSKERDLLRIAECAARLVEHADFRLGGVLSADSKARDIPSRACSQVKARHLAALRDALAGRASLAASAGSEPVAQPSDANAILAKVCDLFHIGKLARTESTILVNVGNVIRHADLLHAVERALFPQPELPEDDDPYSDVGDLLPAPNSWAAKDDADYVAQFREALAARGFTHPSPPEGAGWRDIATAPKDGTLILVHFGSKGVRAVSWDSPFHDEVTEENGIWCVDDDKHGPYGLRGYIDEGPSAPTHWMPLPAPPASEAKGA